MRIEEKPKREYRDPRELESHSCQRELRPNGVEKLTERIYEDGYNPNKPLGVVIEDSEEYVVIGGHRLAALKEGLKQEEFTVDEVPVLIYENTDPVKLAKRDNQDEDTYNPEDLFDNLDLIKYLKDQGKTQKEIGERLDWSREKVAYHQAIIKNIVTEVLGSAKDHQEGRVTNDVTDVTNFTEGWFRTSGIYDLEQKDSQLEFIKWFIKDKNCNAAKKKAKKKSQKMALRDWGLKHIEKKLSPEAKDNEEDNLLDNLKRGLYKSKDDIKKAVSDMNEQILERNKVQIKEQDAFDLLFNDLKENSVDAVVTDPPYSVTDQEWDQFDDSQDYLDFIDKLIKGVKRVTKDEYQFFLFCSPKYFADIELLLRDNDLPIKSRIIWVRKNMSKGRTTNEKFISHYEPIFHVGNKELNFPDNWGEERFDVQEFAVPQSNFDDKKQHPTQKPVDLIKRLVDLSTDINDLIVDPFCGAGTTAKACKELKRRCITTDMNEEYIKIAKERVK